MIYLARMSRQFSETGVYHIILRGINKDNIFLDSFDKQKIIKEIKRTKEKYEYEIYAYCLMTNHIHLLVKDTKNNISKAVQSLAVSYSLYFNKKYDRVGHLFQNRFHSRCVETQSYLLNVQRYIHRNPEKAGIAKTEEYKWSSYNEYFGEEDIVDTKFILNIFDVNIKNAQKAFMTFTLKEIAEKKIDDFTEYEIINKLTDEEAKQVIEDYLDIENASKIKDYNFKIRDEIIKRLKGMKGTSTRQLERIIGVDHKIISKLLK